MVDLTDKSMKEAIKQFLKEEKERLSILTAEDWENACHELIWKNDPIAYQAIENRALEIAKERMKDNG